ncbi:MAG: prolyl aminopeptidase [Hyphomonadaceae bacterium]|nr:prolyl aminopeptidase [Hyphomonadaceae bacterium]
MFRLDTGLKPPRAPYVSGMLAVGDGHELYWEEAGDPDGTPLLIVHGGPGGGINPYYRQMFDPTQWRAILFEQRGCGRSVPYGSLAANTTTHLVADMEALRIARRVERWVVLGGSWGSTLALAYAQAHRTRCAALVVTGVFLARAEDRDWWWRGARALFPELWAGLRDAIPEAERGDLRQAYLARILGDDPDASLAALKAMLAYETQMLDLFPNWQRLQNLQESQNMAAMGRLYGHYDANAHFLEEGQLLAQAPRLAGLPGWIVNGRYDSCTPPSGAYDLAQAWPDARLRIVPAAAHVWNDPILSLAIDEALRGAHAAALAHGT